MSDEVVVAGAGFAGVNAAIELADQGYDVELIDQNGYHEFTPGVIDLIRGRLNEEDLRLDLPGFFADTGINFNREKILQVDPEKSVIETNSGQYNYENLVIALGYDVRDYGLDVSDAEHVYNISGAKEVAEKSDEADSAIVVGSGYVGLETAAELGEKGLDVTLIDQVTRPMPRASEKVSEKVLDYLNAKDIDFRGGKAVEEVNNDSVVLEKGQRVSAEMVIWSGGMGASEIIQRDFDCGPEGVEVNQGLNSQEYSNVFAAGPCADIEGLDTAYSAIDQSSVIAENMSKSENETLEHYEHGKRLLVVSLGKTGMMEYGEKVFKNRIFRHLKDLIRKRYWFDLYWKKLKLKI